MAWDLVFLDLQCLLLMFSFPLVISLVGLTMIFSSIVFVDKWHVAPRLSLVNVTGLNRVLRSKIFVSEDGQL